MDEIQYYQDKLVGAEVFAERLGVGVPAVRKWVAQKKVPYDRLHDGRTIRFRESDIEQIIRTGSAIRDKE